MVNKDFLNGWVWIGLCFAFCLSFSQLTFSQADLSHHRINLSYEDYLKMVLSDNLEYAAERYNVHIADARIEAAKVFQNPSVLFDWAGGEVDNAVRANTFSAEISKTFEIGQKRKARINLAKSESFMINALLDDYLRNLQADATLDYLDALKQNYLYEVMLNSYQMMKELSDADSIRYSMGSIKAIDATQSKIEAGVLLNDLLQAATERKNASLTITTRTSVNLTDTLFFPVGNFDQFERPFTAGELLATALNNRADLLAAKINISYNQNLLLLTKRERRLDIDLNVGMSNSYLNNSITNPTATEIYAGIEFPLNFSNLNKADIKIAQFQIERVELLYKQVEIDIQNEVFQAFNLYNTCRKQVDNYNTGLLAQAEKVLNGKMYSYSRGETSLLEVLNAQRTYNVLQTSYYETLHQCYVALVELERAVGIWDIKL